MKYILINELYEKGGAEMQTRRERDLLRLHGHEVLYITLDESLASGKIEDDINHWNFPFVTDNNFLKFKYRFGVNKTYTRNIRSVIEEFNPDCIHINNVTDVRALSVYKVLKDYYSIQTIRDFNAVCPTSLCVTDDNTICSGFQNIKKCNELCKKGYNNGVVSRVKQYLNRAAYRKQKASRIASINHFVAPSQCLTNYCNKHGLKTVCINNPFDFSLINELEIDTNKKYEDKIFLYYGLVAEHKGIFQLINGFNEYLKRNGCGYLYIAGQVESDIKEQLDNIVANNSRIKVLGKKTYSDMLKLLTQVYAVVVPSVWMENYPNTVLEGFTTKCLVLGSNRGGIPDMIRNDEWIFDISNQNSLVGCLSRANALTYEEYCSILDQNDLFTRSNNSLETYYKRIFSVMEGTCETNFV